MTEICDNDDPNDAIQEAFSLSQHPFYWFSYIVSHRGRELNRALAPYGMDHPKWRAMAVLRERPGCTMQDLAEASGVDRTSLTHTVNLLIDAGWLERAKAKSDRRSVVLSLTPAGEVKLNEVMPHVLDMNNRCFAGLSEDNMDTLLSLLKRISTNVKAMEESAQEEKHASGSGLGAPSYPH